jgi:hypothetical protein
MIFNGKVKNNAHHLYNDLSPDHKVRRTGEEGSKESILTKQSN